MHFSTSTRYRRRKSKADQDSRRRRASNTELRFRGNIDVLLCDSYGQRVPREASPRSFSLDWTMGLPRGKGRSTAPVLEGVAQGVVDFYKRVVEGLRPYVPRAPQLPEEKPEAEGNIDVEAALQETNRKHQDQPSL